MKHWSSKLLVQSFADSLGDAENLVELSLGDEEFGHFVVTVQRRHGKSAMQLLGEAKNTCQELRTSRDDLYVALSDLMRLGEALGEIYSDHNDTCPAHQIAKAQRDFNTAKAQADYFVDLYAPREAAAV